MHPVVSSVFLPAVLSGHWLVFRVKVKIEAAVPGSEKSNVEEAPHVWQDLKLRRSSLL